MKNNHIRFGVLTSATRTYFVNVQDTSATDPTPVVPLARHFLWDRTTICELGPILQGIARIAQDGPFTCPPENWGLATTPPGAVNEEDERTDPGGSQTESNYTLSEAPTSETLALSIGLPFVTANALKIEDPIGYGRNGAVFRVCWKGEAYALKQFDTAGALGLQSYNRELQAYAMLQKVWGCSRAKAGVPLGA